MVKRVFLDNRGRKILPWGFHLIEDLVPLLLYQLTDDLKRNQLSKQAKLRLKWMHYFFNLPKTPKDNTVNERFNRTLKEEFLNLGNFHPDPEVFNQILGQWLEEFIFKRPHEALGYQTPIEFACQNAKVSKMYSSYTII